MSRIDHDAQLRDGDLDGHTVTCIVCDGTGVDVDPTAMERECPGCNGLGLMTPAEFRRATARHANAGGL